MKSVMMSCVVPGAANNNVDPSIAVDGIAPRAAIDIVEGRPAIQRVIAAGAVPPGLPHDLIAVPDGAVGEVFGCRTYHVI